MSLMLNRQWRNQAGVGNVRYRTYSVKYDRITLLLRRRRNRGQEPWPSSKPGRVRRGGPAGGISQSCQHHQSAHGPADHGRLNSFKILSAPDRVEVKSSRITWTRPLLGWLLRRYVRRLDLINDQRLHDDVLRPYSAYKSLSKKHKTEDADNNSEN
jgi:hypothetical protein